MTIDFFIHSYVNCVIIDRQHWLEKKTWCLWTNEIAISTLLVYWSKILVFDDNCFGHMFFVAQRKFSTVITLVKRDFNKSCLGSILEDESLWEGVLFGF